MTRRALQPVPLIAALVLAGVAGKGHGASRFSHEDWTKVLARFVNEKGLVRYEALAKERADLDRYVAVVEKVSPKTSPELFPSTNDKLAYYLNAYNAMVFRGVLARGPEKRSVWRGLVSGYSFFVAMEIVIGGEKTSLKKLEDRTIREGFKDPRVHAALNCASIGCPRLPQQAFDPERLDEQLEAGMREFVSEKRNVTVDDVGGVVTLSKIFDWFSEDFLTYESSHGNPGGTVVDYLNRYRGSLPKLPRGYKIKFLEYDKAINKQ